MKMTLDTTPFHVKAGHSVDLSQWSTKTPPYTNPYTHPYTHPKRV